MYQTTERNFNKHLISIIEQIRRCCNEYDSAIREAALDIAVAISSLLSGNNAASMLQHLHTNYIKLLSTCRPDYSSIYSKDLYAERLNKFNNTNSIWSSKWVSICSGISKTGT